MRHIKLIVPKFYEYPLIISRCVFVVYILIRNGLLTEIKRLDIINEKYQPILNTLKFILSSNRVNFTKDL